jgi:DNA excision repair protein ERCC-3
MSISHSHQRADKPLIVQSDRSVFLDTDHRLYEDARDHLARFAELVKSPEHLHTYTITPLSLWNAAASGLDADHIVEKLAEYSRYELPGNVVADIRDYVNRYGRVKLLEKGGGLVLVSDDEMLLKEVQLHKTITPFLLGPVDLHELLVRPGTRGHLKQAMIKIGYPVEDLAGYQSGEMLAMRLRENTLSGKPFVLRKYQKEAINAFYAGGSALGGSGVIVLPCGAGKTMVGMGVMEAVGMHTLILVTNIIALRQWRDELLDKTDLNEGLIAEYSGEEKAILPITVSTYQIMTYRRTRDEDFIHFPLFNEHPWGLIIYDEVHLLPAPVFRAVAEIQSKRRLGLTATLIREDGKEDDVFSLIGPKKYDVPWKELEAQGWIAEAVCREIRLPLALESRLDYALAGERRKFTIASINPAKLTAVEKLMQKHQDDSILIIGQFLEQLQLIAERFKLDLITGAVPNWRREELYNRFRRGELKTLVVSKVANFALDLPCANVAIQVSGTFGSRQEEAQRLGRILRPKPGENQATFYTIVTRDTREAEFAMNRQLFLTEQGYHYDIEFWET